jgi:hypothetical protein
MYDRNKEGDVMSAETALQPVNENVPARADIADFTGYEDLDPSAFIIPRVKVVQPTSKEGTPGKFYINLTGEEFDRMNVVVVKTTRGRVMWDKDDPGADKPLCRSFDFLRPDPAIENPPSDVCARHVVKGFKRVLEQVCPMTIWNDGERPPCDEVYNLLCLSMEEMIPFWLQAAGSSIRPVRNYVSAIALRRQKLYRFATILSLEERREPHRYFILKFSKPIKLDDEVLAEIEPFVVEIAEAGLEQTIRAEEAANADTGANDEADADVPDWVKEE